MKFKIESSELLSKISQLIKVINSKNTLPVLGCFLVNIEDKTMKLTATDTETTLRTSIRLLECDGSFSFALPSKTLFEAIKALPSQPIDFVVNENTLSVTIKYNGGKFNLMAMPANDYPVLKTIEQKDNIILSPSVLLDGIGSVLFCTSNDDLRPVMKGVFVEVEDSTISFVGTDANRMAVSSHKVESDKSIKLLLPDKAARMLTSILQKEVENIEISFDDYNVEVYMPHYTATFRQIEGRFPNWKKVIPNNDINVCVDRLQLLSALKRVSLFANSASGLIRFDIKDGVINLECQDVDNSTSATEVVTGSTRSGVEMGEIFTIGFKAQFIIEAVQNITTDNLTLNVKNPTGASLVLPFEGEKDFKILLMPMLINE